MVIKRKWLRCWVNELIDWSVNFIFSFNKIVSFILARIISYFKCNYKNKKLKFTCVLVNRMINPAKYLEADSQKAKSS